MNLPKVLLISFVIVFLITIIVKFISDSEYYIPKNKKMSSYDFIQDRLRLALDISEPTSSLSNNPTENADIVQSAKSLLDENKVKNKLSRETKETKEKIEDIIELRKGGRLTQLENAIESNLQQLREKQNSNEIPNSSALYFNLKSGWCFIGNDRGYRSCFPVGRKDMCISENIYPTRDICIHPTLRHT